MSVQVNPLPEKGSVLGIDVGYSETRRSSSVCRLDWDSETVAFITERFCACEPERSRALVRVGDRQCLVAALDGPLRSGLGMIGRYRRAEQLLTRRLQPLIGKPGQASAPVGRLLNMHANICAKIILELKMVRAAVHGHPIHNSAVVEAFPSSFLGLLIADPISLQARRRGRSDIFYSHLVECGGLISLLQYLLPNRSLQASLEAVTNHDDRAALVCALTALCVAAGDYTVVGDVVDGWIVLPPPSLIQSWGWSKLVENSEGTGLEWTGIAPIHQAQAAV
jgi:hypothetical protein